MLGGRGKLSEECRVIESESGKEYNSTNGRGGSRHQQLPLG